MAPHCVLPRICQTHEDYKYAGVVSLSHIPGFDYRALPIPKNVATTIVADNSFMLNSDGSTTKRGG